jgi:DNA-binding NtrC family response regulator
LSDFDFTSAVRSDACVLLTGKDKAVRAVAGRIHSLSGGRQGPFTIVDCGGPEEIVERALFGVPAETGSSTPREPRPRLAQAGTVLLQDVERLGPHVQSRLADRLVGLRGKPMPGSSRCRLMASTSEPLLPRVLDGTFDDRLFYRLNVIHLVISSEPTTDGIRESPGVGDRSLIEHGAAQDSL